MIQIDMIRFYEVIENNRVIGVCRQYDFETAISEDDGLRYGIISEENFKKYAKEPWVEPKSKSWFGRPIITTTKNNETLWIYPAEDKFCCGYKE